MKLIESYQKLLLKDLLESNSLAELIPDIPTQIFNPEYQEIFKTVKKSLDEGKQISYKSIEQKLINTPSSEENVRHLKIIKKYIISDNKEKENLVEEIHLIIRKEALQKAVVKAISGLEQNNLEEAEQALLDGLLPKTKYEQVGAFYFDISIEEKSKSVEELNLTKDLIKTLVPSIDNMFDEGGWLKTQLILIAARLGTGKSYTLSWLAKRFLAQKKVGLYINLEMSMDEQVGRLDSAFLEWGPKEIKENLATARRKLRLFRKKYGNNLYLMELPPGGTTMITIKRIINDLRLRGIDIDFLIVDGADYLSPIHRTGDMYFDLGNPYKELKRLAVEEHILIVADCQLHRKDAEENQFAQGVSGTESIAHSYLRAMASSVFITLNQTKSEYDANTIRWHVAKTRAKGKKYKIISLGMSKKFIEIYEIKGE